MSIPPGTLPVVRRLLYAWLGTAFLLLVAILVLLYALRGAPTTVEGSTPSATAMPTATQAPTSTPTILATASLPALSTASPPASATASAPASATSPAGSPSTPATPAPSRLPATATPTATTIPPTAIPTPVAGEGCRVTANSLNLRDGPGAYRRLVLRLERGESFIPLARSEDANWLRIVTYDGIQGWVSRMGVFCARGELDNLPVVATPEETPTPVPTATPVVITEWRGAYYNNTAFAGTPMVVRNDRTISFDWGSGAPDPRAPADNFSVRWTREMDFDAGIYRFHVHADDGVRLWVDGNIVVDQWRAGDTTYQKEITLRAGRHSVRLEYMELGGKAAVALDWARIENYPDWRGEYYNNESLAGAPIVLRSDAVLDFDWGQGAPDPGLPADYFSARWTREADFAAGAYRFRLRADDGARLWIDGNMVMDERHSANTTYEQQVTLSAGRHALRVEYFELGGGAVVALNWARIESYPDWKGEYFDNENLRGAPVVVRNDSRIDFSWGQGSPAPEIPDDHSSARWSGRLDLPRGAYRFRVQVDDGARLWVNGVLVVDAWKGPGTFMGEVNLSRDGKQDVRLDYHENAGWAEIRLSWERIQPTATASPRATVTRPATLLPTRGPGPRSGDRVVRRLSSLSIPFRPGAAR